MIRAARHVAVCFTALGFVEGSYSCQDMLELTQAGAPSVINRLRRRHEPSSPTGRHPDDSVKPTEKKVVDILKAGSTNVLQAQHGQKEERSGQEESTRERCCCRDRRCESCEPLTADERQRDPRQVSSVVKFQFLRPRA